MAITYKLRSIATGKPISPDVNPHINREPSRKAIRFSGITGMKEFHEAIRDEIIPSLKEIARKSVEISRNKGKGIDLRA